MSSQRHASRGSTEESNLIILSPDQSQVLLPRENEITVTIRKSEYEDLLRLAREYKNLRTSLLDGGLLQETLDVLVEEPDDTAEVAVLVGQRWPRAEKNMNTMTSENSTTGSSEIQNLLEVVTQNRQNNNTNPSIADTKYSSSDSDANVQQFSTQNDRRTILIRELPDRCAHRDIAEVIRGGALIEIFLRVRERSASVSFVTGSDAADFLDYSERHGIYIFGKRVEVSWSDRQFYLSTYVAAAIANGASRNILICGVNPNITEALIRSHLDHIHNLIVLNVRFYQRNAYISTNSVHNAMYAKSCLMSRAIYKGMKIGYFPDECVRPMNGDFQNIRGREQFGGQIENVEHFGNRYRLLALDCAD